MGGTETDVDCGGGCAPAKRCANGLACNVGADCTSSSCVDGICTAAALIVKNAGCSSETDCPPAASQTCNVRVGMLNTSSAAIPLDGVEIRYYFTSEFESDVVVEVDDKSITTFTASVEAMTTPVAKADSYVSILYTGGTLATDSDGKCTRSETPDCAEASFRVHQSDYAGSCDPSNDYSFIPFFAAQPEEFINNNKIVVMRDGQAVWGTEP